MGDTQFLRTYVMECGKPGSIGFQVGNIHSPSEETLHVNFSIEKSDSEISNNAKVQIWNLSPTNLKMLDEKDVVLYLKAGYGNNRALVLAGEITSVTTELDGSDKMTEIEVVDGRVALRDTYLQISKNGKVKAKTLYDYIASEMGVPVEYGKKLEFAIIPNGFSFVGKAATALTKIADACGHSWTIQNGILQVTKKGEGLETKGFLLSTTTGLISIPKKVTISEGNNSTDAQTGYEIEYFLNGAIGINDVIAIKSSQVSGFFRVKKIEISGDNYSGDWICKAQVIAT